MGEENLTTKAQRAPRIQEGGKKIGLCLVGLIILVFLICACRGKTVSSPQPQTTPLPGSMKGYELYSWQADGQWQYTLVTGTNRPKTLAEITADGDNLSGDGLVKVRLAGTEELKAALSRLPEGEQVFWVGPEWPGLPEGEVVFDLPPEEVVEEIREHCSRLGLFLQR
jgi:hypothetical protein